jgi:hypothetical protein
MLAARVKAVFLEVLAGDWGATASGRRVHDFSNVRQRPIMNVQAIGSF